MIVATPSKTYTDSDLGEGFLFRTAADGDAAIVVPALGGEPYTGVMSTAALDARDEEALSGWLRRWNVSPLWGIRACNQVHGVRVLHVDTTPAPARPDADAIWTSTPAVAMVLKAADCAPVWVFARTSKRLALVHAGWRGVAGGIVEAAIDAVAVEDPLDEIAPENPLAPGGSVIEAADITVAVGPHLQSCCFEVGPEVAQHFLDIEGAVLPAARITAARKRSDSVALSLSAAIAAACKRRGITAEAISISSACTRCHPEMFHSYRRNGTGGPLMAAVALVNA